MVIKNKFEKKFDEKWKKIWLPFDKFSNKKKCHFNYHINTSGWWLLIGIPLLPEFHCIESRYQQRHWDVSSRDQVFTEYLYWKENLNENERILLYGKTSFPFMIKLKYTIHKYIYDGYNLI